MKKLLIGAALIILVISPALTKSEESPALKACYKKAFKQYKTAMDKCRKTQKEYAIKYCDNNATRAYHDEKVKCRKKHVKKDHDR